MRLPVATYRLQFHAGFGFAAAAAVIGYLRGLGISDIYASPVFRAASGSAHGYDVVDHGSLNPELGSADEFQGLLDACSRAGLGWIQDIVPNHGAFDTDNYRLMDICENGMNSEFYSYFDIEWEHPYPAIRGRLLAPFLGKFYVEALEQGDIRLAYGKSGFTANYFQFSLPLKIETYAAVLTHRIDGVKESLGGEHSDYFKLLAVIYILKNLPPGDHRKDRREQIAFVKRMLWELYTGCTEFQAAMQETLASFNGIPGEPASYNLLDDLLNQQIFRLAFWKVGTQEINYRRFFGLNNLICLRVENPDVFEMVHELPLRFIKEGTMTGLRVDHIDGLWDPAKYLDRLRFKAGPVYIVVEKILTGREQLPAHWPIHGTTGYEFLNAAGALLCDARNSERFDRIYENFIREPALFEKITRQRKRLIIRAIMTADIDNMALFIKRISAQDRCGKDITLHGLRQALVEVMTMFPVYRTYISYQYTTEEDRQTIARAIQAARVENPDLVHEFDFIERFLLLRFDPSLSSQERNEWVRFVMQFQQFTGPLMAKGFEDTALYVYNRLISRNDVGCDPSVFGISVRHFHRFNQERARHWPAAMNATSTHDSKRGEDTRARISVLSEIPQQWQKTVRLWRELNRQLRPVVDGRQVPDRNDEYFLYQTLVGMYPDTPGQDCIDRVKSYSIKAARESKTHTQWINPVAAYEDGLAAFINAILTPASGNRFLPDFTAFCKKIAWFGACNSLTQVVLKIASPGIPDFYQGSELWDLSLVDPDNRRPVDFKAREAMLQKIQQGAHRDLSGLIRELLAAFPDPEIKVFTIFRALQLRCAFNEVFAWGQYVPLRITGPRTRHLIAFARIYHSGWVIAVAPRFLTGLVSQGELPLGPVWQDTHIDLYRKNLPALFTDAFTGLKFAGQARLDAAALLQKFPVALLSGELT